MEYGNKIFEIYNKPFKYRNSSSTNYNKVRASGIEPNTKFVVNKTSNVNCAVYPRHGSIEKVFYWGDRKLTQATAEKRCGYFKG
ncbi:TPA: hypothetical protein ACKPRN_000322 [Streptococcus pyogenes]